MTDPHSTRDFELPWRRSSSPSARPSTHLVIAWSLEEPDRVGQTARIDADGDLLGRGDPDDDDATPRLGFGCDSPRGPLVSRPLRASRLSRAQARFRPHEGGFEIEALGRCPVALNGVPITRARIAPGDVITFRNAMVLLVAERSARPRPLRAYDTARCSSFGLPDVDGIVGESPAAWALRDDLAFAAAAREHVLVLGESGAGKELAAQAIHAMSPRAQRRMSSRNAATLPEGLVDAELFGCAKNYPNAGMPERTGLIGEADGSTLFLDEIGELGPSVQAHLLRVLDRGGEYQRLGESRSRTSDLRLVCATNRGLDAFKHDLLARLPLRVTLPGLDDRREDIPLLIRHILLRLCESTGALLERFFERRAGKTAEPRIDPDLIELLIRHRYTTHVRELERLLWLALSTSHDSFIAATDEVRGALTLAQGSEPEPDRAAVESAMEASSGNVTRAARLLGLRNRYVLYRLMKRFGMAAKAEAEE